LDGVSIFVEFDFRLFEETLHHSLFVRFPSVSIPFVIEIMVNYFNYFFKHNKFMAHDKVNEVQREMLPEFFLNFFIFIKLLFEQLTVNFDIA
jgi:hypothetical protein